MKIEGVYKSVTIYALKHQGRPIYVGQCTSSVKVRVFKHFNNAISSSERVRTTCPKLYDFIRANPEKSAYSVEILEQCTREDASKLERDWIQRLGTKDHGCNVTVGGRRVSGKDHYLYGKSVDRHIVEASVRARIGKPLSEEHKAKIRAGNLGKRCSYQSVMVECIDTGERFDTITAASSKFGVTPSAISQHLLGKTKFIKGHRFRRIES